MSEKFTPGNWSVHDRNTCGERFAVGSDHDFEGHPGTTHRRYVAQIMTLEDAHLIAAAPELYEALKDMLSGWQYIRQNHGDLYGVGWDRAEGKAVAALAKARGETQ